MRILIHGINFYPELTGIGKYTGEMADWLTAQGHEVRVVTAPPYYPQWRVEDGFKGWLYKKYTEVAPISSALPSKGGRGTLEVYRCPLWVPAKPSGLKRLMHLASFAVSSFPIMLWQIFWRPDVVWMVEPTLMCAPAALVTARASGGIAWLHVQDYEVDAAFELGLLRGLLARHLVNGLERWFMHRFDRVSTISQRMLARALAKGVASRRVVLFPNWVAISGLGAGDSGLSRFSQGGYRAELGIAADAVVALYSGNMGGKQGLETLVQAATLCYRNPSPPPHLQHGEGQKNLVFVFCGDGSGRADLLAMCDGLPNVRFLDLQPLDRLGELLAMADIHLLPQRADAADLVMPSKLTGMLASGRPVVATAHRGTDLANVVVNYGLVVPPGQPQAFADAITTLVWDAPLRAQFGAAGRKYAEMNLDRDLVLRRFETELITVSGRI